MSRATQQEPPICPDLYRPHWGLLREEARAAPEAVMQLCTCIAHPPSSLHSAATPSPYTSMPAGWQGAEACPAAPTPWPPVSVLPLAEAEQWLRPRSFPQGPRAGPPRQVVWVATVSSLVCSSQEVTNLQRAHVRPWALCCPSRLHPQARQNLEGNPLWSSVCSGNCSCTFCIIGLCHQNISVWAAPLAPTRP